MEKIELYTGNSGYCGLLTFTSNWKCFKCGRL